MNIKRRLFLSNILMIIIPLVFSLAVFFGGLHFYAMVAGMGEEQPSEWRWGRGRGSFFLEVAEEASIMAEKWQNAGLPAIMRDVEIFNARYEENLLFLTVYKGNMPITALPSYEASMVEQALSSEGAVLLFSRAHAQTVGDYRVVLYGIPRFARQIQNYGDIMRNGAIVSLFFSVLIIMLTNRFLTRFVFKRVVRGMDTLTHGVHQVRDGNLSFRIDYEENDEFSQLCGDFNEMAAKLLASVEARRKDERSRKELIAGISHDLRTPLTSIKAYVEGLEQGVAVTQEAQNRYIDTIKKKAGDLEHIIDSLFLFSKLDTGEFPYNMERVDLANVVTEIVDGLKEEYANRELDISPVRSSGSPYVNIDVVQIRNVIINIFENSVKYKNKTRGKINVEIVENGGAVSLIISDDGPGVPEDALPKLFDVFYRSDESRNDPGKGSGLGLAITAKMVGHFRGSVEALNIPEGGLSIKMTFPGGKVEKWEKHGEEKNTHN